jgi:hypothetical protein
VATDLGQRQWHLVLGQILDQAQQLVTLSAHRSKLAPSGVQTSQTSPNQPLSRPEIV